MASHNGTWLQAPKRISARRFAKTVGTFASRERCLSDALLRRDRMTGPGPLQRLSVDERQGFANDGLSHGEEPSLRELLEEDSNEELHSAICRGDPAVVCDLLRSGADPDAVVTVEDGDNQVVAAPLHTAVEEGNLAVVRLLVRAVAEPNVDSNGPKGGSKVAGTALHIAVSQQDLGIVQLLPENGDGHRDASPAVPAASSSGDWVVGGRPRTSVCWKSHTPHQRTP